MYIYIYIGYNTLAANQIRFIFVGLSSLNEIKLIETVDTRLC